MVARCDNRNAGPQKIDRDFPGNATATGRVFTIHDREIDRLLFFQLGQAGNYRIAPRRAHDVAEEKYP